MRITSALLVTAMATLLYGCGSSHDTMVNGPGQPPVADAPVNFGRLVASQVVEPAASSETAKPLEIETVTFTATDDETPTQFDAVIANPP